MQSSLGNDHIDTIDQYFDLAQSLINVKKLNVAEDILTQANWLIVKVLSLFYKSRVNTKISSAIGERILLSLTLLSKSLSRFKSWAHESTASSFYVNLSTQHPDSSVSLKSKLFRLLGQLYETRGNSPQALKQYAEDVSFVFD